MSHIEQYKNFQNNLLHQKMQAYTKKRYSSFSPNNETTIDDRTRVVDFKELDKGCLLYLENEKYPMRFHMPEEKVKTVAQVKRLIPMVFHFIRGTNGFSKKNLFQKFLIIITLPLYQELLIDWIYWAMSDVYEDVSKYNQPVREIYRVIKKKELREPFCAIMEYDSAYRYRPQDLLAELNKEAFDKNPIKELERLLTIAGERELSESVKNSYKMARYGLWYLRFNRKLLGQIKEAIMSLDLDEVKPSIEDRWWMNKPTNYNSFGRTNEERTLDNKTL